MRAEAESIIDEITALFRRLSAADRRVLQRRLRLSGLMETEEVVADRNRVEVATALGVEVAAAMEQSRPAHQSFSTPSLLPADADEAVVYADDNALAEEDLATGPPSMAEAEDNVLVSPISSSSFEDERTEWDEPFEYQSAVSGRVVVGAPDGAGVGKSPTDPHMMLPLPGQAPEYPIRVVFGGGSKGGDPGIGYGSYALDWPGLPRQLVQLQFGNRVTHIEAEYDTLIAALEGIAVRLADQDADLATAQVDIRGGSELVIRQVRGEAACEMPQVLRQRERVFELLDEFEEWSVTLLGSEQSNRILGL